MKNVGEISLRTVTRERRMAERLNIPLKVKFQKTALRADFIETMALDVSGRGLKLSHPTAMKHGETVKVLLYFPKDKKPVSAYSKVMWCKEKSKGPGPSKYHIGLKHMKISKPDKERFVFLFCELMLNYFMLGRRTN